jgi:hypothetical protein
MRLTPVIKGLATYIPGMYNIFAKQRQRTGGTDSAEYCYEVWIKHLTMLWENGMRVIPDTIAELGPGDSLGVGLAALLSGVKNYYAFDVIRYTNTKRNIRIVKELVDLFKRRARRPAKGWPDYDRYLDLKLFPSHILTEKVLDVTLAPERIESIRNALLNTNSENGRITVRYIVPWNGPHVIMKESVDVILSHAVLEHVTNLEDTYKAFSLWLRPQGWMSHQIDFTSHGLTKEWNGHLAYPELLWKIVVGKRPYLINRQPYSKHITLMKENGFKIICHLKNSRPSGIKRSQLASCWRDISEDDLTCSGTFIQARKTLNGGHFSDS